MNFSQLKYSRTILIITMISLFAAGCKTEKHLESNEKPSQVTLNFILSALQIGDLACYIMGTDATGNSISYNGNFEVCEQEDLIGEPVTATIQKGEVADCEGIEPCGKTRVVDLIISLEKGESSSLLP